MKRADDTNAVIENLSQQVSTLTAELAALKNSLASEVAARKAVDGEHLNFGHRYLSQSYHVNGVITMLLKEITRISKKPNLSSTVLGYSY